MSLLPALLMQPAMASALKRHPNWTHYLHYLVFAGLSNSNLKPENLDDPTCIRSAALLPLSFQCLTWLMTRGLIVGKATNHS
jgi:hypothetical protein